MIRRILIVLVPAVLVLASCGGDGSGTLEALVEEEGETNGFADFTAGTEKSFGIFICADGGEVELESVSPTTTEGEIEFLGALVYTSPDMFVGAAHGWPTDGLDESRTEPVEGAIVDSDCDDPEGDERVQLLVGAQRTGSGGGVIDGLLVETSGGDLEIPYTILLCGNEMEFCEVLVPEEDA